MPKKDWKNEGKIRITNWGIFTRSRDKPGFETPFLFPYIAFIFSESLFAIKRNFRPSDKYWFHTRCVNFVFAHIKVNCSEK